MRGYVPGETANRLADAFRNSVSRIRADGIPALTRGASHYGLSTKRYFDAIRATRGEMTRLFDTAKVNLVTNTNIDLQAALPGHQVRAARHQGRDADVLRAAAWAGGSATTAQLACHDDEAQTRTRAQSDFEIRDVRAVCALNIYPACPRRGGELRIYNVRVDQRCREARGVGETGYPYPEADLSGFSHLDIEVRRGDLVLIFGALVHCVLGFEGSPTDRQVVNGFLGMLPNGEVVRWA